MANSSFVGHQSFSVSLLRGGSPKEILVLWGPMFQKSGDQKNNCGIQLACNFNFKGSGLEEVE